ncbi:MAG: DUF4870 domain-containing protein [Chloroflexota bacterium]|nr:DUF4870 domain-containing protein [Chloroflexota bacterium]
MQQRPESPQHPPSPGGAPPQPPQMAAGGMDRETERLLAGVAHGAIAFGLLGLTLPISLLITGIIWLYSRRSPYVRFHSDQAGCYQCSVLLINVLVVVILAVSGGFAIFGVIRGESTWAELGLVLWAIVLFAVWFAITIVLGIVGAVMVLLGRPFKYPFIGDWFLKRET